MFDQIKIFNKVINNFKKLVKVKMTMLLIKLKLQYPNKFKWILIMKNYLIFKNKLNCISFNLSTIHLGDLSIIFFSIFYSETNEDGLNLHLELWKLHLNLVSYYLNYSNHPHNHSFKLNFLAQYMLMWSYFFYIVFKVIEFYSTIIFFIKK